MSAPTDCPAVKGERDHTQGISDSRRTLGASSVRADNDGILVIGNVKSDIPLQETLGVKVVYWNIEEALILAVMKVTNGFRSVVGHTMLHVHCPE